jgi:hypothetical protein
MVWSASSTRVARRSASCRISRNGSTSIGYCARHADAISDSIASGPDALRKMVETASELAQWRGTARGLQLALETATGVPGFAVEETVAGDDGRPRPFYVRVIVPADAAQFRPLIERVIATEKPAYVVCEVVFSGGAPS